MSGTGKQKSDSEYRASDREKATQTFARPDKKQAAGWARETIKSTGRGREFDQAAREKKSGDKSIIKVFGKTIMLLNY